MSKRISFKGSLADGLQDRIKLSTIKGLIGYKIVKFEICGTVMGSTDDELTAQIFKKDQTNSITGVVDFTDDDLIAVAFYNDAATGNYGNDRHIIFDNEVVNQDIFITAVDTSGNAGKTNYYIELETMPLTETQATQLTLKNLRTILS